MSTDESTTIVYEEFTTFQRGRVFTFEFVRGTSLRSRIEWALADRGLLPLRYIMWRLRVAH